MPDIITKLAFDPVSRVHFEIAGILRDFKVYNLTTGQPTSARLLENRRRRIVTEISSWSRTSASSPTIS